MSIDYDQILGQARRWAEEKYSEAHVNRHCAFANAVAYLVTGGSGGFGGPSLREHAVTYKLLRRGEGENYGQVFVPDPGTLLPGNFEFDEATAFAEPIIFGDVEKDERLRDLLIEIAQGEGHFDDDPADLELLKRGK